MCPVFVRALAGMRQACIMHVRMQWVEEILPVMSHGLGRSNVGWPLLEPELRHVRAPYSLGACA